MPKKKQRRSKDPYALLSIEHPLLTQSATSRERGDASSSSSSSSSSSESEDAVIQRKEPTEDDLRRSPQLKHKEKQSQSRETYASLSIAHPLLKSTSGDVAHASSSSSSSSESGDDRIKRKDPVKDNVKRSKPKHKQKQSKSRDNYALLNIAHPLLTPGDGVHAPSSSSSESEDERIKRKDPVKDDLKSPQAKHRQRQSQSSQDYALYSVPHPLLTSGKGRDASSSGESDDDGIKRKDRVKKDLLRSPQPKPKRKQSRSPVPSYIPHTVPHPLLTSGKGRDTSSSGESDDDGIERKDRAKKDLRKSPQPKPKQRQGRSPVPSYTPHSVAHPPLTSRKGRDTSSGESDDDRIKRKDRAKKDHRRSPQPKPTHKQRQSRSPVRSYAVHSVPHAPLMSRKGRNTSSSSESEDDGIKRKDRAKKDLRRSPQPKHKQRQGRSPVRSYAVHSVAHPPLTSRKGRDTSSSSDDKDSKIKRKDRAKKDLPQPKHKHKQRQSRSPVRSYAVHSVAQPLRKSSTLEKGVDSSKWQSVAISGKGEDDMVNLENPTEEDLLMNLKLRHGHSIIYTYISSVLLAVNPYQDLPIYSGDKMRLYHSRQLGELPPHIFAIAESCYSNMKRYFRNQCCIISGETGAGKTESTKLILQYLAAVSGELSKQEIEQQILESNPILEAFGNAKTVRNDNSSRFGKYVEIIFNKKGVIKGARMEQYLLEKSRVCHQTLEERNYHIFYCMLTGISAEEKKTLGLRHAKDYTFLTRGGSIVCEGRNDAEDYRSIRSAMKVLTFSENECEEIFKLLAAILHLGNVSFKANTQKNLETSDVSRSPHFSVAASLLGVQKPSLAVSFTTRSITSNRESVTKPLNSEQASDCRDAFVKAIYNRLFIWIVEKINRVTYKRLANKDKSSFRSIGLLDIFGFEDFDTNSFEQLCINFANERLQQFFVDNIFKMEQEEYRRENIGWTNVKFADNKEILDLLAGKHCNLLALIDEESHFPKGTDDTMLQKMNQEHRGNNIYIAPKQDYDTDFGIRHFAGVVTYDTKGFLEKNRDAISFDIIKMLDQSSSKLLRELFETELATNEVKISTNNRITMTPKNSLRIQPDNFKQVPTLGGQFRQSLDSLMKTLSACTPFFIRCIKPNSRKLPKVFDEKLCKSQLRYSGIMDTIRIRKRGYPVRHTYEDFLQRYMVLLKTTHFNPKTNKVACCEAICKRAVGDRLDWKKGKTKIFLKQTCDYALERMRERELYSKALVIQKTMRGYKERKSFLKKRRAAVVLQRRWRIYRNFVVPLRKALHGYARLVSRIIGRRMRLQFQRQQAAALTIQSQVRGYWVRKEFKQKRQTAVQFDTTDFDAAAFVATAIGTSESGTSESGTSESDTSESDAAEFEATQFKASEFSAIEFDDSNEEFSFSTFSIRHFQDHATHTHIKQRLTKPLLSHDDESDKQACLDVWWMILRYMEDLPEPEPRSEHSSPISRHLPRRQAKRGRDQKTPTSGEKFGVGERGIFVFPDKQESMTEERHFWFEEDPALNQPLSSTEKVHIITENGLTRPDIRDEIYCQICKQLVNNKNQKSQMRGWTLLSICLGIFPPTDRFMRFLENFVRRGPNGYDTYCAERLRRIKANRVRKEVPCWIEIQAAKSRDSVEVSVNLSDGRTLGLRLDPASTSAEVCRALADKIDLKDTHGFSLYIGLDDKMWSLGSGRKHVFDAVSQCEQEMRRLGKDERDTFWRLYLRKEVFTQWHDSSEDPISTNLIYRQIIKGLKAREYTSVEEDEYVDLAAKHYYVQFGSEYNKNNMEDVVEECVPTLLIVHKSMTKWTQLVSSHLQAHLRGRYVNGNLRAEKVKEEVVDHAQRKWPLYFSKSYDVKMTSGPSLPKNRFSVAVNSQGILFMREKEKKLLELPYIEIKEVRLLSGSKSVSLNTVRGGFVLKCDEAKDMATLVDYHLDGLKQRSVYAVAQKDFSKPDDHKFLVCKQGDVLVVERDGVFFANYDWVRASNQRTRDTGAVYREALKFLPTLSKPSDKVLELLTHRKSISVDENVDVATLKEFSLENFRPADKDVGRQGAFEEKRLWVHSKDPLKQPLLKKLVHNSDHSNLACNTFIAILKYMGDYPMKHAVRPVDLTDQIFRPAIRYEALQDEIYCQIMKQMTYNNNSLSMDHGWQLLWLCSGLFPPSHNLMRHAQRFVETRLIDQMTADCLERMQEMRSKEPRKFPPHLLEVNAIQHNSTRVFQKIFFPDDSEEVFQVTTTTTIKELTGSIASHLKLKIPDQFGLYIETSDKLMHLEEKKYFFDYLRQTSNNSKKGKKVKEGSQSFRMIFKRRLWVNVNLGEDQVEDNTFHFPQELSNYLEGHHNCTKEDVLNLSGLLLRVKIDSDRSQLGTIARILKDLVPEDQIKSMSSAEWKKHISSSYDKQSGLSAQEAKISFLRTISRWPTFGCTFFEVRQTIELSIPYTVLIAVSKRGVSLINPKTKKLLVMHPFNNITDYSSKDDTFQMTTDTLTTGSNFVCETPNANTMESLFKSYKSIFRGQRPALQSSGRTLSQRF